MANKNLLLVGVIGAGALFFFYCAKSAGVTKKEDVQINPALGKHRGLGAVYGGENDQLPVRMASKQDPKGGLVDYLGYNYGGTEPSRYAMGEPAQYSGRWWDKREDAWAFLEPSPVDYLKPPLRIPKTWKDANRYWDGIVSYGGTEVVGQRLHLFHLRPSMPTRGIRSISGSLAKVGGGQSTASTARIPAIFIPSAVG